MVRTHSPHIKKSRTTPTTRARIVTLIENGKRPSEVAKVTGYHQSTVSRVYEKYHTTHDFYHTAPRSGRPRKFTSRDDHLAVRKIRSGAARDATHLQREWFPHVTAQTVRRHLRDLGLPGRRRRRKFYLTRSHIKSRKQWAQKFKSWTVSQWKKVVFSDEFRINFIGSDGCQWCRRGPGEEFLEQNVEQEAKYGGGHIMVWGCMTSRGFGRLRLVEGNMDTDQYICILEEALLGTLEDQFIAVDEVFFQQDNDPKHTARRTRRWLEEKKLQVLDWASNSPDMNAIEHVWARLKHNVHERLPVASSREELWGVVQEEWEKLDKEFLETLYQSMPRRVAALYAARGSYTKY